MKNAVVVALAALALGACTSVETTAVSRDEVIATGGEAVAVVQGNAVGLTALFHIIDLVPADLDTVVNKLLVTEAKAVGASRVDLKEASTTPRHGIFHVLTCPTVVLCPTLAQATGVAVVK